MTRPFLSNSLRAIAAAAAVLCAQMTCAEPLTLTVSQSVQHDSNFSRTEEPISNTISGTGVQLGLNKPYGRQVYKASAKWTALRYKKFGDLLNNDAKDFDLGFETEMLSNWRIALDGSYGESLNQFENNLGGDRVVRNIRTNKGANLEVIYGVAGIWAVVGSAGKNQLDYSLPAYQYLDYHLDSRGLKAVYYSTDLLNYSIGVRNVQARYQKLREQVNEKDLDLGMNWVVSGLSRLQATLSLTSSKREMPVTSLVSDRRFKGVTGSLNWVYTPHGVMTYGVSLYRTANSDQFNQKYLSGIDLESGALTLAEGQSAYHNQMTAANLYAKWALTGKISLTASTQWNHFKVDNAYVDGVIVNDASNYRANTLSAFYDVESWLKLSAGVTRYSQSKDPTRNPYSGHAVNVAASFVFD